MRAASRLTGWSEVPAETMATRAVPDGAATRSEDPGPRQRLVVDALGKADGQRVALRRVEAGEQQAPPRLIGAGEDVGQLRGRLALAEHGLLDADAGAAFEVEGDGGGRAHAGCAGLAKALPIR